MLGSPEAFDEANPVPTEVPFLLPHELLHELSRAGSLQEWVSKQVVPFPTSVEQKSNSCNIFYLGQSCSYP